LFWFNFQSGCEGPKTFSIFTYMGAAHTLQKNMDPIHSTFHSFCNEINYNEFKFWNVNKWTLSELGPMLLTMWSTSHVHLYIVQMWIFSFQLLLSRNNYIAIFNFHLSNIYFLISIFKIFKCKSNVFSQS